MSTGSQCIPGEKGIDNPVEDRYEERDYSTCLQCIPVWMSTGSQCIPGEKGIDNPVEDRYEEEDEHGVDDLHLVWLDVQAAHLTVHTGSLQRDTLKSWYFVI
jgi:hypothetical protein